MYTYLHICMIIYTYVHTNMYVYIHVYIYIYVYVYVCVYMYIYIYIHTIQKYVYICVCVYMYIYIYMYQCIHIHVLIAETNPCSCGLVLSGAIKRDIISRLSQDLVYGPFCGSFSLLPYLKGPSTCIIMKTLDDCIRIINLTWTKYSFCGPSWVRVHGAQHAHDCPRFNLFGAQSRMWHLRPQLVFT